MFNQNEITEQTDLLDDNGILLKPGWAKNLLWKYDKKKIKASKFKIKEWDYYCILNSNFGISITISDLGYMGFISITLYDFNVLKEITKSIITFFPLGKLNLSETSDKGDIFFENKLLSLEIVIKKGNNSFINNSSTENSNSQQFNIIKRIIKFNFKNFYNKDILNGNITLDQPVNMDTIVVATPFKESKKAFYYNQKINCMNASGYVNLGNKRYDFNKNYSYGVLDWGRGVWPYKNKWYWGSLSTKIDENVFGFNIGYGFGDLSTHTENAVFYNYKINKLNKIKFHIPEHNLMDYWYFTSNDKRFEAEMKPVLNRSSKTSLLLLKSEQHQIFGQFSGYAILDNGNKVEFNNELGFAEKVLNKW